jgi:hypothetical protein
MAITIDGTAGTIAGLVAGGLPDASIVAADIASGVIPAGGITEADHWRLTADITSNTDITTNLERVDDSAFSVLGTGMTQSSGVFTFPSTGYWLVTAKFAMHVGSIDNVSLTTFYTIDTGSNWIKLASAHNSNHSSGQLRDTTGTVDGIFDVTNTSTHKVKFTTGSVGSATVFMGHTDHTLTGFMFIKLGDT